jgi:acetyl esterase/lipase
MPWPWIFLAVTLVGAWFTFNAYLPQRARGPLVVPSFFAGWLTSELSAHHFAWQLAATVFFVWVGALEAWPGWLGLGITLISWVGLLGLTLRSRGAGDVVEGALVGGLGPGYRDRIDPEVEAQIQRPLRATGHLLPFAFRDPEVRRFPNIPYAPEHGFRGKLDVYLPRAGASRAPVLFQIHGGGWTISQKAHQALPLMTHLARAGWVCVAPNYRLSPKATFPDHLVDLKRALAWVREHIGEYGGDPRFVAVTGGSAGGHLTAMMGLTANDPEYQPGFQEIDTTVQACIPFYGVYDFTDRHQRQRHDGMATFLEKVVLKKPLATHREEWEKASPMHRIHPDAPPFLVVHGTHDSLTAVEEARLFVKLLRESSKQPVCYAELPGAQHAFEAFHSWRTTHVVRGVERFLAWAVAERGTGRAMPVQAPQASGSETTSITT